MQIVALWTLVSILIIGFIVCYGYVIGVTVKDLLPRLDIIRRLQEWFRHFKDRAGTDESTYGKPEPREHGSDYFGGC